jgi:DNA-binding MarR family transcriptional regulator
MSVRHNQRSPADRGTQSGDETDLIETILRSAQQIRRLLNDQLEECDLNDVRYAVLCLVSRTADRGGCSQAELAARLDQSESSISMLVDRMRADRLLHRLHAPTDRRRRRLVLTDEGRLLLEKSRNLYERFVDTLLKLGNPDADLGRLLAEFAAPLSDVRVAAALRDTSISGTNNEPSDNSAATSSMPADATINPTEVFPAA